MHTCSEWTKTLYARSLLLDLAQASMRLVNGINSFILQELLTYSRQMRPGIVMHPEEPGSADGLRMSYAPVQVY